jgi:predicted aconitase with swiveling domain
VVRIDARLHRSGDHDPLERCVPVSIERIVLRGRRVVGGCAEGEALVTHQTIPGWGGVNPIQGVITETRHELRGQSFKNKVLVFRGAKGSSGWSAMYHTARLAGTAPLALVFNEMTTKVALGAVVMRIPSVTELDRDPLDVIETGDWVKVDADAGTVEVFKGGLRC